MNLYFIKASRAFRRSAHISIVSYLQRQDKTNKTTHTVSDTMRPVKLNTPKSLISTMKTHQSTDVCAMSVVYCQQKVTNTYSESHPVCMFPNRLRNISLHVLVMTYYNHEQFQFGPIGSQNYICIFQSLLYSCRSRDTVHLPILCFQQQQ